MVIIIVLIGIATLLRGMRSVQGILYGTEMGEDMPLNSAISQKRW